MINTLDSVRARQLGLAIFLTVSSALAGATGIGSSGGGHAVSCQGKPTVTLDFFDSSLTPSGPLINPEAVNVEKLLIERLERAADVEPGQKYRDAMDVDHTRVSKLFEKLLAEMGTIESWPDRDLKIIGDHKLIYDLPPKCMLEQAAAQDDYGSDTRYFQNSRVTKKLSSGQKSLLRVHEALYSIVRRYLGVDSKPVRNLLNVFLLESPTDVQLKRALSSFMQELKQRSHKYVCSANYYRRGFDSLQISDLRPLGVLRRFGRTSQEAFSNMPASTQYGRFEILCNRFQPVAGSQLEGICLELAGPQNCTLNQ